MSTEKEVAVDFGDDAFELVNEYIEDGLTEERARAEADLAIMKAFEKDPEA